MSAVRRTIKDCHEIAFLGAWLRGELPVAPRACTTQQLHRLYLLWCWKHEIRTPLNEMQFSAFCLYTTDLRRVRKWVATRQGLRQHMCYCLSINDVELGLLKGARDIKQETLAVYFGRSIAAFEAALRQWHASQSGGLSLQVRLLNLAREYQRQVAALLAEYRLSPQGPGTVQ